MTKEQKLDLLIDAYKTMSKAKAMTDLYEANFKFVSKYVHATSRGHEAIQIALGTQLTPQDFVAPYYRDDAMLLSIGMRPYELMLQLMAKRDDPFSGGRSYYCHPSLKDADKPKIPHGCSQRRILGPWEPQSLASTCHLEAHSQRPVARPPRFLASSSEVEANGPRP